jgi:histidyl-tRNA synthetase
VQIVSKYLEIIASNIDKSTKIEKLVALTGASNKGYEELTAFFKTLDELTDRSFKISLDFSLARGLSYYTGMIYEVKPTEVKIGSICGGGRYDNLTGMFGLKGVSGIGVSFGLDRIYDVLAESNLFPKTAKGGPKVLITHLDASAFKHGIKIIEQIRKAGIAADLFPDSVKIQKQMNYANKLAIPYVITIGSDEISQARYPLKNMSSGKVLTSTIEQIIKTLKTDNP